MTYSAGTNTISAMTRADLNEVAAVHLRAYPDFFLSRLGLPFLRCLYEEILNDPSGIVLVCRHNLKLQGFAAGTTEPRGFYGRLLLRRWHRFALASVLPVLRNPAIVPRLLNAFRKTKDEPDDGCGLFMSLGVDPQIQARGIGAALAHAFLAECRSRGLSSVHLTTDRFENDRVNRFHSKVGFTISRVITTPQGREMNDYRIELT
jgi:GNAT superfamily N-acetyltransferase